MLLCIKVKSKPIIGKKNKIESKIFEISRKLIPLWIIRQIKFPSKQSLFLTALKVQKVLCTISLLSRCKSAIYETDNKEKKKNATGVYIEVHNLALFSFPVLSVHRAHFYRRIKLANPKNIKYPPESVKAIRKTPEDTAGSTLNLLRVKGMRMPARLAIQRLQSMAMAIIRHIC